MSQRESVLSPVDRATALLHTLVGELVDRPDAVRVAAVEGEHTVIYEVSVEAADMSRVIGRGGRTANAVRELMSNLGGRAGRRYVLELIEPQRRGAKAPAQEPPPASPEVLRGKASAGMYFRHEE